MPSRQIANWAFRKPRTIRRCRPQLERLEDRALPSVAQVIASNDKGNRPKVRVLNGLTGALIHEFEPFAGWPPLGVRVAAVDRDGDGLAAIIAATGSGVAPKVRFYKGTTRALIGEISPFGPGFWGGIFVG
jgi:hypothetical protein